MNKHCVIVNQAAVFLDVTAAASSAAASSYSKLGTAIKRHMADF